MVFAVGDETHTQRRKKREKSNDRDDDVVGVVDDHCNGVAAENNERSI